MSELEFLTALRVDMVRHRQLRPEARRRTLFQTSTIEALLGGVFDGDLPLSELLQHGDLGQLLVEPPPAVDAHHAGALDQDVLRQLESDR